MSLFYQIKSEAVLKILNDNLEARKKGLEKALAFGEKEGFEVCAINDGCYRNIGICVSNVPEDKKAFFKRRKDGIYTPKMNTKVGKFWAEKIEELQIKLTNPFPKIREETGYENNMVISLRNRTAAFPKIIWIGKNFFLQIPKSENHVEELPPIDHPFYEPKQRWELEKLIAEEKGSRNE